VGIGRAIWLAFEKALPYYAHSVNLVMCFLRTLNTAPHKENRMKSAFFFSWKLKPALAILFIFGLAFTAFARAEEARLTDMVATDTGDDLLIYFRVIDCFTDEMKKAIENGITTTFTFFIILNEVRSFQWDKKIADLKISHSIVYDSLKKVYKVRISERNNDLISVPDFQEARNLMSKIVGLKVTELNRLKQGKRYEIQMMAELEKIRLPLYLDYVFFFLSLWDFETDWYTVNFTY
jgi:hypothetical protein